jgi:hypothetical protein
LRVKVALPDDVALAEAQRKLGKTSLEGDEISVYQKELLLRAFPDVRDVGEVARLGRHYLHLRGQFVSTQQAAALAHLVVDEQFSKCTIECVVCSAPVKLDRPLHVVVCDSLNGVRDEVVALTLGSELGKERHLAIALFEHVTDDGKIKEG